MWGTGIDWEMKADMQLCLSSAGSLVYSKASELLISWEKNMLQWKDMFVNWNDPLSVFICTIKTSIWLGSLQAKIGLWILVPFPLLFLGIFYQSVCHWIGLLSATVSFFGLFSFSCPLHIACVGVSTSMNICRAVFQVLCQRQMIMGIAGMADRAHGTPLDEKRLGVGTE